VSDDRHVQGYGITRWVAEHPGRIIGVRAPTGYDGWWEERLPEPIQVEPGDVVIAKWTPNGAMVRVDRGAA
jgi:hypothetical protein